MPALSDAAVRDPWLTVAKIADHTSLHPDTIRAALAVGALDGVRVSPERPRSPWRARLSEVDRWMLAKSGKRRHRVGAA